MSKEWSELVDRELRRLTENEQRTVRQLEYWKADGTLAVLQMLRAEGARALQQAAVFQKEAGLLWPDDDRFVTSEAVSQHFDREDFSTDKRDGETFFPCELFQLYEYLRSNQPVRVKRHDPDEIAD